MFSLPRFKKQGLAANNVASRAKHDNEKNVFSRDRRLMLRATWALLIIAVVGCVFQLAATVYAFTIQNVALSGAHVLFVAAALFARSWAIEGKEKRALQMALASLWVLAIVQTVILPTAYPSAMLSPLVSLAFAAPFISRKENTSLAILAVALTPVIAALGMTVNLFGASDSGLQRIQSLVSVILMVALAIALLRQFFDWLIALFSRARTHRIEAARGAALESQIVTRASQLVSQNEYFSALHETALGIVNHLDLKNVVEAIVVRATQLVDTQHAFIQLFEPKRNKLNNTSLGVFKKYELPDFKKGEDIVGTVWETGKPLVVNDYRAWCAEQRADPRFTIRSAVAVPIRSKEHIVGVLCLAHTDPKRFFSSDDIEMMMRFGELSSVAYDNTQLYEAAQAELVERRKAEAQLRENERLLEKRVDERTRELRLALEENEKLRIKSVAAAAKEERSRLARDLHDSVSQAIYGITLGAQAAVQIVKTDPAKVVAPIEYVNSLAEIALKEMRALIYQMRPESLQREGLIIAFKNYCEALAARYNLDVRAEIDMLEPEISFDVKEAVNRVGQEALFNAIKHANASRICLRMWSDADSVLKLEVADNGNGFDTSEVFIGHYGLNTMRERIEVCGGKFDIESAPGKGTTVRVVLPNSLRSADDLDADDADRVD
jgi:signal transduction histidine kinase